MRRPSIVGLHIADPPQAWGDLGFEVSDTRCTVGSVELQVGGEGRGITDWELSDHLPPAPAAPHPNGVSAIDHVVLLTADFDATAARLASRRMPLSRERTVGELRQGFVRLGEPVLELAAPVDYHGPERFWGITFVCADLDALAQRLGDRLSAVRDAVQSGRRIAPLREGAGPSTAVAFMTPEPCMRG